MQTSSLRTNAGEQRRPLIDKVSADLTKRIQDLLAITKLITVFETFDNEAEALASFGS